MAMTIPLRPPVVREQPLSRFRHRNGARTSVAGSISAKMAAWVESLMPDGSIFVRGTLAASALAVAPLRYLLQPNTAPAVVTCGDCRSGTFSCPCGETGCTCSCGCSTSYTGDLCCEGFSAFCCQLGGGSNYGCPSYAWPGGWWKCECYAGTGLCSTTNVKYIVDCNTCSQSNCPNGCHCAGDKCSNRRTCCIKFRYGQCNVNQHTCTGSYIVCRLVTCINPTNIGCLNCTDTTVMVDDCTCRQTAPCLP